MYFPLLLRGIKGDFQMAGNTIKPTSEKSSLAPLSKEGKLITHCQQILTNYPSKRIVIGYSGGRDSHVLLDIFAHIQRQQPIELIAIHVNHRLQSVSDEWAEHCQQICQSYNIPIIIETVTDSPKAGESIEAFARNARYRLIEKHLKAGDIFISAHHQRDQAETFLLQLMRGAGLDGLKAMPVIKPFGAGQYLRPLLHCDYQDIVDYATDRQLNFINDDSNNDTRFDRNFIRHEVLPILKQRFPNAEQSISRSATWLAEIPIADIPDRLSVSELSSYRLEKQKQQIRSFIKAKTNLSLSQNQTDYIINHHLTADTDRQPIATVGNYIIRRFADEIIVTEKLPENIHSYTDGHFTDKDFSTPIAIGKAYAIGEVMTLQWEIGQGGLDNCTETGYRLGKLDGKARFCPHYRQHSTTVKKLLYEAKIQPWLRPLILGVYLENELVAIPTIGVAKKYYKKTANAMMPMWIINQKFVRI